MLLWPLNMLIQTCTYCLSLILHVNLCSLTGSFFIILSITIMFSDLIAGCGSSGWQAPEQLLQGRQTRAVDLFSLGCVLFFCMTAGRHPFGERLERDVNIVKNKKDLFLVEFFPEAEDLVSRLLNPDPNLRYVILIQCDF